MTPRPAANLVHAPLAHWAQVHADAVAIRNGTDTLTFAQLHQAVTQRAYALTQARAPATVLVNDALPMTQRLVDFLGIVASGRCAAVGDPDWPPAVRDAVVANLPTTAGDMPAPIPQSPFYIGYTSGSTGIPKGYRRHHQSWTESFRACLDEFGADARSCILAPGRDSHSLFLFGMLLGLWSGAGVVVQAHFSAPGALDTLRSGHTPCLVAVPSQLLLMLDVAQHRSLTPISAVRLILVSGSRWDRSRTAELRRLFPCARIIEFYGASEASFVAWMDSHEHTPADVVGHLFKNVEVDIRRDPADAHAEAGLIYVRSPMLFMDYVGGVTDGTAAIWDGDWLSVRDLGYLDAQGRLCLKGRQNRMIVTQGNNLFPEELESVLEAHPAIACASVHGVHDPLRGRQVVAVLRWSSNLAEPAPTALQLVNWCRSRLESYKTPRHFFICPDWCFTASGKADHRTLAQRLHRHLDGTPDAAQACLSTLH